MVVDVRPEDRDGNSDVSRLTVKYRSSLFETPTRFVNRNDLNAKSDIGADFPLTRTRKCFIYETQIDRRTLENILNTNGFLSEFLTKIEGAIVRLERANPLTIVYPRITSECSTIMHGNSRTQAQTINFLFNLMSELKGHVDLFMYQAEILTQAQLSYLESQDSQFVPVLNIHKLNRIKEEIPRIVQISSSLVPFVGLTYASYRNANLAYDYVMSVSDKLHESNKGIITVGIPRVTGNDEPDHDVSATHYSSFLASDIAAEKFETFFNKKGQPNPTPARLPPRIFEKDDLAVPMVQQGHNGLEHVGEDQFFRTDIELDELFWRTVTGDNSDLDYKRKRVNPMSRVQESIVTNMEYEKMRKSIVNQELTDYRNTKKRLNKLLTDQGL